MTTLHAREQSTRRLARAGLSAVHVDSLRRFFESMARLTESPTAAYCMQLPTMVGAPWSDRSNGDVLVAIVREKTLVTVFLRRSSQSMCTGALRVERVYHLKPETFSVVCPT